MSRTRLVLVRHVEPDQSVRDRVYGRLDPDVSPAGAAHAAELAASLAELPLAAVYASPLRRALATARPVAGALGLEPVVVDSLRELDFGELEGLTVGDALAAYPLEAAWMTAPGAARFPGGESFADLRERVRTAIATIVERHAGEEIAVVSHAIPIRTMVADALGDGDGALFRFGLAYGGISVVDWADGRPFLQLLNARRL